MRKFYYAFIVLIISINAYTLTCQQITTSTESNFKLKILLNDLKYEGKLEVNPQNIQSSHFNKFIFPSDSFLFIGEHKFKVESCNTVGENSYITIILKPGNKAHLELHSVDNDEFENSSTLTTEYIMNYLKPVEVSKPYFINEAPTRKRTYRDRNKAYGENDEDESDEDESDKRSHFSDISDSKAQPSTSKSHSSSRSEYNILAPTRKRTYRDRNIDYGENDEDESAKRPHFSDISDSEEQPSTSKSHISSGSKYNILDDSTNKTDFVKPSSSLCSEILTHGSGTYKFETKKGGSIEFYVYRLQKIHKWTNARGYQLYDNQYLLNLISNVPENMKIYTPILYSCKDSEKSPNSTIEYFLDGKDSEISITRLKSFTHGENYSRQFNTDPYLFEQPGKYEIFDENRVSIGQIVIKLIYSSTNTIESESINNILVKYEEASFISKSKTYGIYSAKFQYNYQNNYKNMEIFLNRINSNDFPVSFKFIKKIEDVPSSMIDEAKKSKIVNPIRDYYNIEDINKDIDQLNIPKFDDNKNFCNILFYPGKYTIHFEGAKPYEINVSNLNEISYELKTNKVTYRYFINNTLGGISCTYSTKGSEIKSFGIINSVDINEREKNIIDDYKTDFIIADKLCLKMTNVGDYKVITAGHGTEYKFTVNEVDKIIYSIYKTTLEIKYKHAIIEGFAIYHNPVNVSCMYYASTNYIFYSKINLANQEHLKNKIKMSKVIKDEKRHA